jgi:hypothetical protein
MKTRFLLLFAVLMSYAVPAVAALPPEAQRAVELERIVLDGDVRRALNSNPIDSVTATGVDLYEVVAGPCRVTVTIIDAPTQESREGGWVGPRLFALSVGKPSCQ